MTGSADLSGTEKPFLDVGDAEIVHGPDVIAGQVARALKDADRFGLQSVKPPLSEALNEARRAGTSAAAAESEPAEQNALAAAPAKVDEGAGSEEMLKPGEAARDADVR